MVASGTECIGAPKRGPALSGVQAFLVTLDTATRIETELGVGRIEGDGLAELRLDGGWLDANNGLVVRPRVLLVRPPTSIGTGGFAFTGASLRF